MVVAVLGDRLALAESPTCEVRKVNAVQDRVRGGMRSRVLPDPESSPASGTACGSQVGVRPSERLAQAGRVQPTGDGPESREGESTARSRT